MELAIQPLTPVLGAEVTGLDLKQAMPESTTERLNAALADYSVLVIRNQQFTAGEYLDALSRVFGEPMEQHYSQYHHDEVPLVGTISHRDGQKPAATWHTDHTNHERPPKATVLYAVSLPSSGGDTSFASMRAAYANLSETMQAQLQDMRTINTLDSYIDARAEDIAKYGAPVVHPLVRTHPENGTKSIYFHPTKSKEIEGMTPETSQAFLKELLDRVIVPEIIYRHQWQSGDMVIFDNRAVMHKAHGDYDRSELRLLYRIILKGDRPV